MANQIPERINAPPISEFRFLSQLAVEQLPAIIQIIKLSEGMQLTGELELTGKPNIHRYNLCKTTYNLENERTFFQGCEGNLEGAYRLNFNYEWWEKQTIVDKEKFQGTNTNIIEWFRTSLTIPLPSTYQFFE